MARVERDFGQYYRYAPRDGVSKITITTSPYGTLVLDPTPPKVPLNNHSYGRCRDSYSLLYLF